MTDHNQELVERVARAVRRARFERTGRVGAYDPDLPLHETEFADARAAIAAAQSDGVVEARGTTECPYCGDDEPHHHRPEEIANMVRGLPERLEALAREMALPAGFYSAAHRVYGTDYGGKAEELVSRDLAHAAKKLRAALSAPEPVEEK